jgi:BASS family bile acid:Na+ symporter
LRFGVLFTFGYKLNFINPLFICTFAPDFQGNNEMNSILIVLPILTILMFDLGLTLEGKDFLLVLKRSKPLLVGLFGQLILPMLAWGVAVFMYLDPIFTIGLVLIACCPGGSSSNIFSMLAKGDVALSVSLTALSSIITLFTLPLIMQMVTSAVGQQVGIQLPVKNLLMQNLVTMLLPIVLGIMVRYYKPKLAAQIERVLSKLAFPALMLLAGIFFVQHRQTIADNLSILGLSVTALLLVAVAFAAGLCYLFRLHTKERRTIIIEVGMQNAAQAIAIASSPFVFNDGRFAIPAIMYALMMNVVLLTYVAFVKFKSEE